MKLHSFDSFLVEAEKVKLDKDLREYTLTHVNDAIFQLKSSDFYKEFSVVPYKQETVEKLKSVYSALEKSVGTLSIESMYDAIIKAEAVPYKYGNVYNASFDLKGIPELTVSLEQDQLRSLAASEREFLANNFSSLNKEIKDMIVESLRERCEVLCAVIEALFYYIRTIDKDNFYEGMNSDEIAEEYEKEIEKASKEVPFSYEGPFADQIKTQLLPDSRTAFWECEKDTKKFFIQGTISPKELRSEENVGGTKGLKLSLTVDKEKMPEKDYNYFNITELATRVKMFNDKILKKI